MLGGKRDREQGRAGRRGPRGLGAVPAVGRDVGASLAVRTSEQRPPGERDGDRKQEGQPPAEGHRGRGEPWGAGLSGNRESGSGCALRAGVQAG